MRFKVKDLMISIPSQQQLPVGPVPLGRATAAGCTSPCTGCTGCSVCTACSCSIASRAFESTELEDCLSLKHCSDQFS